MLWAVGNSQREEHKDLLHVDSPDPNPPQGSEKEGPPVGPTECLGNVSALDLSPPLPSACFLGCGTLFQISPAQPGTGGSPLHPITSKQSSSHKVFQGVKHS